MGNKEATEFENFEKNALSRDRGSVLPGPNTSKFDHNSSFFLIFRERQQYMPTKLKFANGRVDYKLYHGFTFEEGVLYAAGFEAAW